MVGTLTRTRGWKMAEYSATRIGLFLAAALLLDVTVRIAVPAYHTGHSTAALSGDLSALATEPGVPDELGRYLELAAAMDDRAAGMDAFQRALELRQKGDSVAARDAFDRAADAFPGLADWAHLFAAEAAAGLGDTRGVERHLERSEPALVRDRGWRFRARAHRRSGDMAGAVRIVEAAASTLEWPAGRAEALRVVAELELIRGDTTAARAAYRRAMEAAPMSAPGLDAARALGDLVRIDPADRLAVGRVFLRHGNMVRAEAGIDAFLASGGGTPTERAEARLDLGRALFRVGRYEELGRRLAPVTVDSATPAIAAEALLLRARASYRQDRKSDAVRTFQRVAEGFPGERAAAEALYILGDLAHDDGELSEARGYYQRAIVATPESEHAGLAAMRLGTLALMAGDHAVAGRLFEEHRTRPGAESKGQGAYWAGLTLLAERRDSMAHERLREALRLEPVTYYGLRAARLLGEPPPIERLPAGPETVAETRRALDAGVARVAALRELGLEEPASYETERLKRYLAGGEDGLYVLAEWLHQRGDTYGGIMLGREIQRATGSWNRRLLRIIYPFPFRASIEAESRRNGLDPAFVAALIRQESMFNPLAVSGAGAIGLMQVTPSTGRALAASVGIRGFTPDSLADPAINVRLGTLYLAQLFARYGDRVPELLAAYNAGPSRLARWRAFPEYGDAEIFSERIPYGETRDYVRVVQGNAEIYRALYGPGGSR